MVANTFKLFGIDNSLFTIKENSNVKGPYKIDVGINFSTGDSYGLIRNSVEIKYSYGKAVILKAIVDCYFDVLNEGISPDSNNNTISFSAEFLRDMASVTLGAARGVLYSKTLGTTLSAAPLPIINLSEIIVEGLELTVRGY